MKKQSKSLRLGGYSVLASAIVIAIAIAVNLLVGAIPAKYTRFDTSPRELYTLGDTTQIVLKSLDQDIDITWLVTEGKEDKSIELLLQEYTDSSSRIHVTKQDPDLNPTLVSKYTNNFYDNSLVVQCGDRDRFVDFYDIYTIQYDPATYMYTGDYQVEFSGENAITGAINYVTNAQLPKLYALTGHGEADLSTNFNTAVKLANVEMAELNLVSSEEVPKDADAVMINAPQSDLTDAEIAKLQDYLALGGRLLMVTGPQRDGKALPGINKLMEKYAVQAVDGIVIDQNSGNYANNPAYLMPELVSNTITIPLKNGNYRVMVPFAQGLDVQTASDSSILVNKLLRTSNSSYSKLAAFDMTTFEKEEGDIDGSFAIGVAISQTLDETQETETRIVWYTSTYLLDEEVSRQVAGANQTMFMNTIGWLCDSEDTGVVISAKSLADEKLNMSASTVNILTVLFVAVIPLCYLAIGIVVWVRRRHR